MRFECECLSVCVCVCVCVCGGRGKGKREATAKMLSCIFFLLSSPYSVPLTLKNTILPTLSPLSAAALSSQRRQAALCIAHSTPRPR